MGSKNRSTDYKITLFAGLFQGLRTAYGTYCPETGKHRQVKQMVKKTTLYRHLKGIEPFGFYPLVGNATRIGVVDFDNHDPEHPLGFIIRAHHFGLASYLEKSKSKGYHAWIFFSKAGVPAKKVRLVIQYILDEIDCSETEIFPKQNRIVNKNSYGNFINAPLFGKFVPQGRTVFIRPDATLKPYPDQWDVLESIQRIHENQLDTIIDINQLERERVKEKINSSNNRFSRFGLPICIQRILVEGVSFEQRVACFRIAVHLKRIGLPYDVAVAALYQWSKRNRPIDGKRLITFHEIEEQTKWAFKNSYNGYGCQEPVIRSFCDSICPVRNQRF